MRRALIKQPGFSLLEVLIGLVVASVAMVMMAQMSAQSSSELRAKNVAESAQAFHRAATAYFLANRAEMMDAMTNTTDPANANTHCRINRASNGSGGNVLADPTSRLTCTMDATHLISSAGLPSGVATNNEARIRWIATFRQVKDGGGTPTDGVDLLVFGAAPAGSTGLNLTPTEARIAAGIMGGNGGAIFETNQPGCLSTQACGSGGGWVVNLSDFGASKTATAPSPVVMAGTIASYTFFPAELSTAGGGSGSAQLPTAAEGDVCATEGAGAITSAGVMLTCIDDQTGRRFRAPGYLPIATEGSACSPDGKIGKDTTGLLLSCQSGVWQPAQGSGKTGLQGVFYPLRNKAISCRPSVMAGLGNIVVDSNGNISLSAGGQNCGAASVCISGQTTATATATGLHVTDGVGNSCTATWPSA